MTISCTNRSLAGGRWSIQYRHGDGGRWAVRPPADAGFDRRVAGIRKAHDAQALVADLAGPADRACRWDVGRRLGRRGLRAGVADHRRRRQPPRRAASRRTWRAGTRRPDDHRRRLARLCSGRSTTTREAAMKLSARNQLPARVVRITSGEAIANVELDVNGLRVVASITVEAVRELGLQEGAEVTAVVKASDVMVAVAD